MESKNNVMPATKGLQAKKAVPNTRLDQHNEYAALEPSDKTYWKSDNQVKGLRLQVNPSGSKLWRFNYRLHRKQFGMALGKFPEVTLANARKKARDGWEKIEAGENPASVAKQKKTKQVKLQAATFEVVAKSWFDHTRQQRARATEGSTKHWSPKHADRVWTRIGNYLLPLLGTHTLDEIDAALVLFVLNKAESKGKLDVAARAYRDLWAILNYAKFTKLIDQNPADGAKEYMAQWEVKNRPTIESTELPLLFDELGTYTTRGQGRGQPITELAIRLLMHTLVRSGELRGARWSEFDLEAKVWSIPPGRMKKKRPHQVPLSPQVIALLGQIYAISGGSDFLFPSQGKDGIMSDNTMRKALFTLGFDGDTAGKSKLVPHGLRALGATILTDAALPAPEGVKPEKMFHPDVIEIVLAHQETNKLKKAYIRHPDHMTIRRYMHAWWSDYLDAAQGKTPPEQASDNAVASFADHKAKRA